MEGHTLYRRWSKPWYKKAGKRCYMVVWDRNDYNMEAEKQLNDKNVYQKVNFKKKLIQDLTESRKKIFRSLKNGGFTTDKELKYFSFDHKRACNLQKLYFLPKFYKRLLMCLVVQWFLIVEHQHQKHLNLKLAKLVTFLKMPF